MHFVKLAKKCCPSAIYIAFAFSLISCGGTNDNNEIGQGASPPPIALDGSQYAAAYLSTIQIPLSTLNPDLVNTSDLSVTQVTGPTTKFRIGPGNILYLLSPPEQYVGSSSTFVMTSKSLGKKYSFSLPWYSTVGAQLSKIDEADENGKLHPDDGVTLSVSGVTGGLASAASLPKLAFKLNGGKKIDPTASLIIESSSNGAKNISAMFNFDAVNNQFKLKSEAVPIFLNDLATNKVLTLSVSFSTTDYKNTYGFEQTITLGAGELQMQVINSDHSPATDLAGVQFIASGNNTGFKAIATLDSLGIAHFTGLPTDTYSLSEVLLQPGVALYGVGVLSHPEMPLIVTIARQPAAIPTTFSSAHSVPLKGDSSPQTANYASSWFYNGGEEIFDQRRNDIAKNKKSFKALAANPNSSNPAIAAISANMVYSVTAIAGDTNSFISSPVSYTVPKGTQNVGIHIDVASQEYPHFTQSQSQFNDMWYFDIEYPNGFPAFKRQGKVNQTHVTQENMGFDQCLDVSTAAKNSDIQISGNLGAENVNDAKFPTKVTLTVSIPCNANLNVTSFKAKGTTTDGFFAHYPRKAVTNESTPDGNLAGRYLSVPLLTRLPATFGMPATINYIPQTAQLTAVELALRTQSGDISLGTDYLKQADMTVPGSITFSGLTLNPTQLPLSSAQTQLVVKLKAKVNQTIFATEGTPMDIDGYSVFTPIFLASETSQYSHVNRFGNHTEAGGDSWATLSMLNWLQATKLPFNDISAASVKQSSADPYKSVLMHSGHSDAQQVDLRYWDGNGSFSDPLSGANNGSGIATLAQAALVEVNTHAKTHPNLDSLVAWIKDNRVNLSKYAGLTSTRRIYIGQDFISKLLINAEFPDTTITIGNVGSWKDMPAKILPQTNHLDHWHISQNLH
ncbi:hypothetical protein [Undibacterium sp. SXout20W]|uniref:hypothetical protein n=1 Tax=Undibacterium sp. SXout20W TaxID=3413051 RepID=UPI003BF15AF4